MPDPVAVWGALTGTAGLGIALRREVRSNKREIQVANGWQYLFVKRDGEYQLLDVFVYVMAWNTGRRPLHIEYAGFEWLREGPRELASEMGIALADENTVWMNERAEIALNSETFEVVPDGPSVKLWTRIQPILGLGIDPTATPVRPFVVTVPEQYWFGAEQPLLPRPPQGVPVERVEQELTRMGLEWTERHEHEPPERPGHVHGLPRLIPEGEVERVSDLFPEVVGEVRDSGDTATDSPRRST